MFRPLLSVNERADAASSWEPDDMLLGRGSAPRGPDESLESVRANDLKAFEGVDISGSSRAPLSEQQARPKSAAVLGFEPLTMDYLTGAPRIETVEVRSGDGFEFEPDFVPESDAIDPDGNPTDDGLAEDDPAAVDVGETEDGRSNESLVDTTSVSDEGVKLDDPGGSSEDSAVPASMAEAADPIPDEEQFVGPPTPMIRESEHLAQIESVRQATREAVWAEAHRKGFEEGAAKTRRALDAELASERAALAALTASIREAALDPIALHAPLRRLAVHLAMELVRGELSLSSDAVGRLIGSCLAEIDRAPGDHIVLTLHPDDMERWVTQPALSLDRVELRSDPTIGPGSVRLSAGDTVIEDLLDHRLSSIATRVLGEGGAQRLPRLGALRSRGFAEGDISDVG
jgi:flagellar biosynthesis/type III secretory pathway protein FliH